MKSYVGCTETKLSFWDGHYVTSLLHEEKQNYDRLEEILKCSQNWTLNSWQSFLTEFVPEFSSWSPSVCADSALDEILRWYKKKSEDCRSHVSLMWDEIDSLVEWYKESYSLLYWEKNCWFYQTASSNSHENMFRCNLLLIYIILYAVKNIIWWELRHKVKPHS